MNVSKDLCDGESQSFLQCKNINILLTYQEVAIYQKCATIKTSKIALKSTDASKKFSVDLHQPFVKERKDVRYIMEKY